MMPPGDFTRASLLALFICLAAGSPAGAGQKSPVDAWPAISAEELALKDDPANPGAKAVLLDRLVAIDDTQSIETQYYRIKILTEAGKQYADIEIPYVDKVSRIEGLKARTVQSGGRVTDFNGQVFDKLVVKAKRVKVQVKAFTLPDVETGSILEYSYTMRGREKAPAVLLHPASFVFTGPVAIPTAHWIISEELATRHARFSIRPLPNPGLIWTSKGLGKDEVRRQPDGTLVLELNNVAGFQQEEFMPPVQSLQSRVDFIYILGPGGDESYFWSEQGKRWAEGWDKFIGNYKEVKRVVEQTVSPNDAAETKLRKLYDRAQQIRFVSFEHAKTEKEDKAEGLKANQNVEEVLKRGYAYANQINYLFVAFARAAGFESAPVLVADRSKRFFQPKVRDPEQLDANIVWVRAGTKDYYLDPATLFCPFDLLPWYETDTSGVRVGAGGGALVLTPSQESTGAVVERKASLQLDREGSLQGNLKVVFTGQEALQRRLDNRDKDEVGRRKGLQEEVQTWLPAGSSVELKSVGPWEKAANTLAADFSIQVRNFATVAGRRLLLPMGIFQSTKAYPFQSATRIHPIYFPYPYQAIDEVTVQLEDGQKVETLPAPRNQETPFASYVISCQNHAGTVELHRKMKIIGEYFRVDYYPALRAFYREVRAGDEQPMVFENVPAQKSALKH